ncbi:thermonuclease family protein [Vibrio breoganii]
MKYLLVLLSLLSSFALASPDFVRGEAVVYRVIDGDTFTLNVTSGLDYNELKSFGVESGSERYFNDKYQSFRVRLANVDTEESVHSDPSRNTEFGKLTSRYVKELIEGESVGYMCWDFGKYDRAICSLALKGQDLGYLLISEGYSDYVTRYGRHPYLHKEYSSYRD